MLDATGDATLARAADLLLARPVTALAIIVGAVLLHRLGVWLIRRMVRRYERVVRARVERGRQLGTAAGNPLSETRRLQRLHAIGDAARSGLAIVLGVTAFLSAVAQFTPLGPLLAGAGLASVVIGFGAQQLIADLLAGFSMLVEDQFGVGDWIDVDGHVGEVENVGLRTTSFRDLDGTVWHVPNGQMARIGNLTQHWARATLEIPLPLDVDLGLARRTVAAVAGGLAEDEDWGQDIIADPEIWGLTQWDADGLRLRLVIPTRPLRNWAVARELRERLKIAFDREGIRMPVPRREVAGTPGGEPVRTAAVEEPTPPEPSRTPFDPASTGRLDAETGRLEPRR